MTRSGDIDLLRTISRIVFANPFGAERDALDRRVAGADSDVLPRLVAKVAGLVRDLGKSGKGEHAVLVEHAQLFDAYHRFFDVTNAHVEAQVASATPLKPTYAPELHALLIARGFGEGRAARLVGLFFQMTRAHFFIARGLVGKSAPMRALREALWNDVFTDDIGRYESLLLARMEDFSTLLLGETGTGKGAAAAAIGRSGFIPYDAKRGVFEESFERAFLALNLGQFAESLLESELFGHRKGAFTGAVDAHEGVFARSRAHGSIFLDEIAEASPPLQVKLLRVLQEREFSPVGSHEVKRFSGRVIAATNRDLTTLRSEGRFRDDLYYRLCSDVIHVPTLRERLDDDPDELGQLVSHLVARMLGAPSEEMAARVCDAIARDLGPRPRFAGNVRELEQHTRRVLLTGACMPPTTVAKRVAPLAERGLTADALLDLYCQELYAQHGTYEAVAAITALDRRTVKRRVLAQR